MGVVTLLSLLDAATIAIANSCTCVLCAPSFCNGSLLRSFTLSGIVLLHLASVTIECGARRGNLFTKMRNVLPISSKGCQR